MLRVVGEERGFQEAVRDERGTVEGSRLPGVQWCLSCEGAIAFRWWTATLYPVEIADGQIFGEAQDENGEHGSGSLHAAASPIRLFQSGQTFSEGRQIYLSGVLAAVAGAPEFCRITPV